MTAVHQSLGAAVVLLALVGVAWAAVGIARHRTSPGLRSYLLLTEAAVVLQGVLGIALAVAGHRPTAGLHFVYGPVALVVLPVTALFSRVEDEQREAVTLCVGCVVLVLIAVRAVTTGG